MTLRHATACALIAADYAGAARCGPWHRGAVLPQIDGFSASQWILGDRNVLVCTGTNDLRDWFRNFMAFPVFSNIGVASAQPEPGASGALYHLGFLAIARMVFVWAEGRGFTDVTGHSQGAAAGGIAGGSLGLQTVTYSAPRVLFPGQAQPAGARHVLNRILPGDPINLVVPGHDYYGRSEALKPTTGWWGFRHGIQHSAMAKGAI